jgi:integrase
MGRKAGGHNRGYFFRKGRGWYAMIRGKMVPLEYDDRGRMRAKDTPLADIKAAYQKALGPSPEENEVESGDGPTVMDVCLAYLAKVKDTGADATYSNRHHTLFDLCSGLPSRFIPVKGKPRVKPTADDYIHKGFGKLKVADLKPLHLDRWLQAHPNWKGGRRTKIQAVKRALNYGVESGLIESNPIKGYKTPKAVGRVTYITPEQETALCDEANPALAMAIKVCIRTGARPGCEFAKLTAKHVKDHGERMEWIFQPHESKTKTLRIIRITDPEILKIVRQQMKLHPTGPIFRAFQGGKWRRANLTEKFRELKGRLTKKGYEFDDDCCMYSCRHTYAKRVLQGYWSGKPTNIETLAKLMGNSPQVCQEHYLLWSDAYAEPLWDNA